MTLKTDTSLKLWLPMNEGAGTSLYDYSGNSNNCTITNNTWGKAKDGDNLIICNGSSSYGVITANSSIAFERTDSFSFCCWFYLKSTGANKDRNFIANLGPASVYRGIEYRMGSNNQIVTYMISTWNTVWLGNHTTRTFTTYDKWYFLTITYDGSSNVSGMKIYVDGVQEATSTDKNTLNATINASTDLAIGNRDTSGTKSQWFEGGLRNFMIFKRVLSLNEIKNLYKETYIE